MNTDSGKLDFEIRLLLENMQRDAKRAQDIIGGIGRTAEKEGSLMDSAFKKAGVAIAGFFTLQQATNFVKQVANVRGEMQNLETAFKTMLGSKKEADALMSQLIQTAATTPFGMSEVANGAKQLLAYGLEADKVNDTLIRLGDIAAGLSIPLGDLSYLYGTTMVQGRLYTQDLNQFLGRGIPLTKELAAQFGVAESEVKRLVEEGKVGFPQVQKAIENLTNEGSKFGGLMQEQSKNINGQISNIEDSIDQMFNNIGKKNEGVIYTALGAVSSLVENYEEIGRVIAKLIGMYGSYKAAIIVLNAAKAISAQLTAGWTLKELAHYKALVLVEKGQKLLNATILKNPYVLVGAAVAGLTAFLWNFFEVEDQTKKATEDHAKALEELNSKYDNEKQNISNLLGLLESETASRQKQIEALEELKKLYPDIIGKYIDENGKITDRVALEKEINTELSKRKELELGEKSANASIMLNRYKEMLKAQESGKGARNADWAKELLADKPLIKSTTAYIKEKIQYWEIEAKKSADEFNKVYISGFKADLESKTDADLEALKKYYEERNKKFAFLNNGELDAINEEIAKRYAPQTAETQNKAFWEKEKQKAVDELNALADIEENKAKRDEIIELIKGYDKHLEFYNTNGNKGSGNNDQNDRYKELLDQQRVEAERSAKDMEFAVEQSRINALAEGEEKILAQMQLNHKRELEELEREKQDYLQHKIDNARALFEADPANQNKVFNEAEAGISLTSNEETAFATRKENIDKKYGNEEQQRIEAQRRAMNEYLKEYGSYLEKRNAIIALYDEQMTNATSEGQKLTLAAQMRKELSELDIEANKSTAAISKLFGDMTNKTVKDMRTIADEAENALQFLIDGKWDEEKGLEFGMTKETFDTLRQSPEELEKIRNGINNVRTAAEQAEPAFKRIGNGLRDMFAAGDDAGKLKDALNDIQSGLSEFSQLGSFLSDTLSSLGEAFGSDVLTGIADGINMVMDAGQSMMSGAMAGAMFGPIGAAAGAAIGLISSLATSIAKLYDNAKEKKIQALQGQIDTLKSSYDALGREIDKSFSSDAANLINQQNQLLEQQKQLIQLQIAEESAKKNADQEQIKAWQDELDSIDEQIADNKDAAENAIYGEDLKSAIENFAEDYAAAWANGENHATSMRDTVRDMMQKMVTESIKAAIDASGAIDKIREAMKAMWADELLTEAEIEQLYAMADQAQAELDAKYGETLDNLNDPNREGVKKGIATASQESVDENNARLTTIQGHTYQLNENIAVVRADIATASAHLQEIRSMGGDAINHLAAIEEHTSELVSMNVRINKMQAALEDINTRGVKIKN